MLTGSQNPASDAWLAGRIAQVGERIAAACRSCGRDPSEVRLLAVSKGHPASTIRNAALADLTRFGESYVQEALPKIAALADLALEWHFIGRLQTNKTRAVAEHFQWLHGLDDERLARRLSAQRPSHAPALNVCIQVNVAGETRKGGIAPESVEPLANTVAGLPGLRLRGLMGILPAGLAPTQRRALFAALASLQARLRANGLQLDTLSMGMSEDFAEAIAEGSTLVRIGTALFGERTLVP